MEHADALIYRYELLAIYQCCLCDLLKYQLHACTPKTQVYIVTDAGGVSKCQTIKTNNKYTQTQWQKANKLGKMCALYEILGKWNEKHTIIPLTHKNIEFRSAFKSTREWERTQKNEIKFPLNENESAHVTKKKFIPNTHTQKMESVTKCAQRSTGFLIFSGAAFNGMYQIK